MDSHNLHYGIYSYVANAKSLPAAAMPVLDGAGYTFVPAA
jgi:hypothetical protein